MPYVGVNNCETWIIAGHQTITTVDCVETSTGTMLYIQFVDGLLNYVIVYDKQPPSQD